MSRRHGSSQDHDSGTAARKPKRRTLGGHALGSGGASVIRGKGRNGIKRQPRLPDRSKSA